MINCFLGMCHEILKDSANYLLIKMCKFFHYFRLNVKVILLVRDPRGTMQSRRHRDWCPGVPDCDQSSYLCADLVADYSAAIRFKKLYPSRFRYMF